MRNTKAFLLASVCFAAMIASARADQFVNGGFEDGTLNGWTLGGGIWNTLPYPVPSDYLPGGKSYVPGTAAYTITNPGTDANTGNVLNTVYAGAHSVMVNDAIPNYSVTVISQTVKDYTDSHISFAFAAVLEDSHGPTDSDAFIVTLKDNTTNKVIFNYNLNSATAPGLFTEYTDSLGNKWYYSNWMTQYINVSKMEGDTFTLSILANDCPYGGHAGYAYLDGIGAMAPISGTGTQYWNGSTYSPNGQVNGGSGEWNVIATNWSTPDGAVSGAFSPSNGGPTFKGAPGIVTVNNTFGQVNISAAQFLTSGYVINGDPIQLNAGTVWVAVGDGSSAATSNITATINASLIGPGGLTKLDNGTLVLNGYNTYAGPTTADTGILIGSATSFGTGDVTIYDRLVIDQPTDANFANVLHGWGSFEKRGAGTLNLTGTSDFWGATLVTAGTLEVSGSLASSVVTVASGATLSGAGTVGGVFAQAGSVIAPGPGLVTLNVAGDYHQDAGSSLQIAVQSTGGNSAISATGAASFTGGATLDVTKLDTGIWQLERRYTILTAPQGVTGTLALNGPNRVSMFYDLKVDYDSTHVYFDVANTTRFDSVAQTRNQRAAADGIYSVKSGPLFDAIGYMNSASDARQAYTAISGEVYASARTVLMEDSRLLRDAFVLRLNDAEDAAVASSMPLGYAPTAKAAFPMKDEGATVVAQSAAWVQSFDNWGSTAGDGNANALKRQTGGILLGYDTLLGDLIRVGVGGGYTETTFGVLDRASSGSSENFHLGLYGGTRLNGFGLKFGAAYSWNNITATRTAAFAGASNPYFPDYYNQLNGKASDSTAQAFGDLSYRYIVGATALEPFDNIAYVDVNGAPFEETGGAAALHAESADTINIYNTIGMRGFYSFDLGSVISTLEGSFGWKHVFGALAPLQPFNFSGGSVFTIAGAPIAQDALAFNGGLNVALTDSLFVAARYDGQYAKNAKDQSVKGAMAYKF